MCRPLSEDLVVEGETRSFVLQVSPEEIGLRLKRNPRLINYFNVVDAKSHLVESGRAQDLRNSSKAFGPCKLIKVAVRHFSGAEERIALMMGAYALIN